MIPGNSQSQIRIIENQPMRNRKQLKQLFEMAFQSIFHWINQFNQQKQLSNQIGNDDKNIILCSL